jgi:ArsR family transcriptional regulator
MERVEQTKALGSAARLAILEWLKCPGDHFAHQASDDPDEVGVCITLIADKLGVAQPTATRHVELLRRAGFLEARRIGRWTYVSRDEEGINEYRRWIANDL